MALPTLGKDTQITYFGHSTFSLVTPGGQKLLIDPWITNPRNPGIEVTDVDIMLISHGHLDHMADAIEIAKKTKAQVVSNFEIGEWLEKQGIENIPGLNHGGSITLRGLTITMTQAIHSSVLPDGTYGGNPGGFIVALENGFTFYFAGDTAIFGVMALLKEIYAPELAFLPIGDCFTMGPREAAYATRLLGVQTVIPMHYATFPQLTGTPEAFQAELSKLGLDTQMIALQPGETLS